MKYSIIVPVYNRPDEVRDLLTSLANQTFSDFETIIVEDGSTIPCAQAVSEGIDKGLDIKYFCKDNEGRSIARNFGMEHASGQWLIFFDSDCVIPPEYFSVLDQRLSEYQPDCFGGPDAAHSSFTKIQKAINYTMTSFLTTGGIRGGKRSLEKFTPRTFNMGFSRKVYENVGGFREMFSEDIDMSTRIKNAGYTIRLVADAPVWHKRRISWRKFWRQVHIFGMSRITLMQLYPGSLKLVHTLPAMAVIFLLAIILLAIFVSPWWLIIPGVYFLAIFFSALISERNISIAVLTIPAATIQLGGYGLGMIRAFATQILTGKGRNLDNEIALRKGK